MNGAREWGHGRERERGEEGVDRLKARVSERVRKACEGNAARLLRIYDVYEMPVGFSLHLKSPGYMDLVIERLSRLRISLSHYGEQNGDLMADPNMEVELAPDRGWVRPLSYQNDYAGFYQSIEADPNPRLEKELVDFLGTWLKNLEEQGFGRPAPEEAARRKACFDQHMRERLAELDALRHGGEAEPDRGR